MENTSVFEVLNKIDCSKYVEKKNGLSYLSWSFAWQELLKKYPDSTYKIYENPDGLFYFTDGKTCWVKTGVTVQGKENIEYLPVMNFRNQSIKASEVTSVDVNKSIQRSLTKAIARHGLGLYIYAGEDLPEEVSMANSNIDVDKLIGTVLDYINAEYLVGDFANKAQKYIQERNVSGLQNVLNYCKQLQQQRGE